jgi:uncharacterized protein (TIGR02679 family)
MTSAQPRTPPVPDAATADVRLRPLWRTLHDRLSSGQSVTRVRIGDWDPREREAVADLLGLDRLPQPGRLLSLAELDRALGGDGDARRLRSVVEQALGPLGDRRASRAGAQADRTALWRWLAAHPSVRAEPALDDWVALMRRGGLIAGSVAQTRHLMEQALAVLAVLPADGVSLPVLADRVLHDPHALDDGRRLSGVVLQAAACLTGGVPGEGAAARRELWQRWGVETDALSSTVLVAGLRLPEEGYVGTLLGACAEVGEAAVLTLAQVRDLRGGVVPEAVHVVENPSVMASALTRLGATCPPLVCTSGWPSAAGVLLLRIIGDSGARLRYHGDLDGDGLRIAAHLVARVGATPWRMTTTDYEAALARRPAGPAVGRVSDVPWDPQLGPSMRASGVAVTEESVVEDLLGDLREMS